MNAVFAHRSVPGEALAWQSREQVCQSWGKAVDATGVGSADVENADNTQQLCAHAILALAKQGAKNGLRLQPGLHLLT
jgi:hypothetical protein